MRRSTIGSVKFTQSLVVSYPQSTLAITTIQLTRRNFFISSSSPPLTGLSTFTDDTYGVIATEVLRANYVVGTNESQFPISDKNK